LREARFGSRIMVMIRDLILKNRSCRRFYQEVAVRRKVLKGLVELARLSPSSANLQPLKYIISCDTARNALIFPYLVWAGYLKDWPGPAEGERPSAYIVILGDTGISKTFAYDAGIAAQSILLGATEKGLAGCMIGSIERDGLRKALDIPVNYEIVLAVAIGKPRGKVVLEKIVPDRSIKYWRDEKGAHHVPKRPLDEVIL